MNRHCGICSLCCKLPDIKEIGKPAGVWCEHCRPGRGGCAIFSSPERPSICHAYECSWRQRPDGVPEEFRPDRVHAIIDGVTDREDALRVLVDPHYPDAWRSGAFGRYLQSLAGRGIVIGVVRAGKIIATIAPRGKPIVAQIKS